MREILTLGVIAVVLMGLIGATIVGLNRSEASECLKWQDQAAHYPGFYLTEWQARQCAAHNIIINAPVK